jgi:hypothetical protein
MQLPIQGKPIALQHNFTILILYIPLNYSESFESLGDTETDTDDAMYSHYVGLAFIEHRL